jgi:hypothetical protein
LAAAAPPLPEMPACAETRLQWKQFSRIYTADTITLRELTGGSASIWRIDEFVWGPQRRSSDSRSPGIETTLAGRNQLYKSKARMLELIRQEMSLLEE